MKRTGNNQHIVTNPTGKENTMPRQQITTATIQGQIIHLPGREPFMLGQDLAAIYETEPRAIYQAVKRNPDRFPDDFVFRLTDAETVILKSQIASSNPDLKSQSVTSNLSGMANRANPLGFTRTGANMLSTVLKSPVAVERSVQIMRAFTTMEKQATADRLRKAQQAERRAEQRGTLEWQSARASGKAIRHQATDAVQQFVQYAESQGSTHAHRYYGNFTRMVNAAFLGEQAVRDPHFRDNLDAGQLMMLAMGERVAGLALLEAMAMGLPYKDCFQAAKARATAMATLMNGVGMFPQLAGWAANSPGRLAAAV